MPNIIPKEQPLPAPRIKPTNKARIGVVCTAYHQQPNADPVSIDARYSRWLESEEQPYLRKFTVSEEWTPLDSGWLDRAGMLVLKNEEGRFQVQPTDAERQEVMSRIIEVGLTLEETNDVLIVCWLVRPLESLQAEPCNLKHLRLRCRHGQARCTLALFPN